MVRDQTGRNSDGAREGHRRKLHNSAFLGEKEKKEEEEEEEEQEPTLVWG